MLQAKELVALIAHKIDSTDPGAMGALAIINEAGRFLVSLRPWQFQLRTSATLPIQAGQSYIKLANDFGMLAGAPHSHPSGGRTRFMVAKSFEYILAMRGDSNPPTPGDGVYFFALASFAVGGPPDIRMELWPTPTVTDGSAFSMPYYAVWKEIVSDNDYVDVPQNAIEGLLRHIVRETAAGYENDDEKSVWNRMDEILGSKLYEAAVMADAGMQKNLGALEGGAAAGVASWRSSTRGSPFYPVQIT